MFTLNSSGSLQELGRTDRDTLIIGYPVGYTSSGTWASTDFSFSDSTLDPVIVQGTGVTYNANQTCSSGGYQFQMAVDTDGGSWAGTDYGVLFYMRNCDGNVNPILGAFTLTINDGDSGANGQLINPSLPGDKSISVIQVRDNPLVTYSNVTDTVEVVLGEDVNISATVDPIISFALSSNTCALGTLTTTPDNNTCSYDITANTNASGGMVISAVADNATLTRDGGGSIQAVSGSVGTIVGEGYGISHGAISGNAPILVNMGNLGDTADQTTASSNYGSIGTSSVDLFDTDNGVDGARPVDVSTITITHTAEISDTTPAGSYSQEITYTAVGTF